MTSAAARSQDAFARCAYQAVPYQVVRPVAALLLLLAAAAQAQPWVTDEVIWGTTSPLTTTSPRRRRLRCSEELFQQTLRLSETFFGEDDGLSLSHRI